MFSVCPSCRPSVRLSVNTYFTLLSRRDFSETSHGYSSCEWPLLKRFARSESKVKVVFNNRLRIMYFSLYSYTLEGAISSVQMFISRNWFQPLDCVQMCERYGGDGGRIQFDSVPALVWFRKAFNWVWNFRFPD